MKQRILVLVAGVAIGVGAAGATESGLSAPAGKPSVADLIEALRDDDVRGNAGGASSRIRRLPVPPIRELLEALDSDDWQQRQAAMEILWSFAEPNSWMRDRKPVGEITPRMLEVAVEGLARDEHHAIGGGRAGFAISNAVRGFHRLTRHAHAARDLLEAGLRSRDSQQRFLCALILGYGCVSESAEPAARVLLPHLRDNEIMGDARWAVGAVYGLGPAVRPSLLRALGGADAQQADLIQLLLLDLDRPPVTQSDLEDRARFNSVTRWVFDPAVEHQTNRSMLWLDDLPE